MEIHSRHIISKEIQKVSRMLAPFSPTIFELPNPLLLPPHIVSNFQDFPHSSFPKHAPRACSCKERFQKRNQRRAVPKKYHQKVMKRDGSMGWQGMKDLPSTATYPTWFCKAIFKVWLEHWVAAQAAML